MNVDFHTHIIPPPGSLPDWAGQYGAGRWPRLQPVDEDGKAALMMGENAIMKLDSRFWSLERRLQDMDRTGVQLQVISPIPMLSCYWSPPAAGQAVARYLNEHIASLVASRPDRFAGMGTVPLQDVSLAIDELAHLREVLKIRAVQIGSCPAGRDLDDPALFPFFQACDDLGMAVFVHPMQPLVGGDRLNAYYLPNIVGNPLETGLAMTRLIVGGVLERLPRLRICFAHAGGAFPLILGRVDKGHEVRPEMRVNTPHRPSHYARMIYVDALTFDGDSLRLVVDKHGSDRVLMGSDYPFGLGDDDPVQAVRAAALPPEATQAIIAGNVWHFLDQAAPAGTAVTA
ncbi:amidohydrolase family protein [Pinirhizobacter soli]|uniref:amidohydrolase family protein n=1 Tax=Pinirhizobacter soli TaxID=2786953 RepID=UPI00202A3A7E|nr:amidohydrolase family protein [Pinirhizobacter soli]